MSARVCTAHACGSGLATLAASGRRSAGQPWRRRTGRVAPSPRASAEPGGEVEREAEDGEEEEEAGELEERAKEERARLPAPSG